MVNLVEIRLRLTAELNKLACPKVIPDILDMTPPSKESLAYAADKTVIDIDAAAIDRKRRRCTRIRQAIDRINAGTYDGKCVTCGEEIPEKRLEADLTVMTCVTCETAVEIKRTRSTARRTFSERTLLML